MSRENMSQSSKPKRSYDSSRRKLQAKETRRTIVEAARKLFYEMGYNNATIDAIAHEAGVAAETIYAVFGTKQTILMNLIQVTLVGDDENVPLLERPFITEALNITDQLLLIKKFASDMYTIMQRMSPIFALLRSTAKTDPEIMALLKKLLMERLNGMSFFVNQLNRIGPMKEQTLTNQANVSVWAISSAEVFTLLTEDLGWSEEEYTTWLSSSLERLLIPNH
jgi:AcrR family transcriptional regulator